MLNGASKVANKNYVTTPVLQGLLLKVLMVNIHMMLIVMGQCYKNNYAKERKVKFFSHRMIISSLKNFIFHPPKKKTSQ